MSRLVGWILALGRCSIRCAALFLVFDVVVCSFASANWAPQKHEFGKRKQRSEWGVRGEVRPGYIENAVWGELCVVGFLLLLPWISVSYIV